MKRGFTPSFFKPSIAVLVLLLPALAAGQVRDAGALTFAGTASISGVVQTDSKEPAPVRRAMVTLSRNGIEDIRVLATDDAGRYTFAALPSGAYTLSVRKAGFVATTFGAAKPGMPGRAIQLGDGQAYSAAPMAIQRGGVIAGRLLDRMSRPVPNAPVTATQFITVDGERRRRNTPGSSGSATTNDHGEYRIYGLLPGDYLVFSSEGDAPQVDITPSEISWAQKPEGPAPPPARPFAHAATLFPGVTSESSAGVVTVAPGEERLGVEFALQYVPVSSLRGVVTALDGSPAAGVSVEISSAAGGVMSRPINGGGTLKDGSFMFNGVQPGEWNVYARTLGGSAALRQAELIAAGLGRPQAGVTPVPTFGQADVSTSGSDVSGISIRLQPAATVSGEFALKGTLPAPELNTISVTLSPARDAGRAARSLVTNNFASNGRFTIEGLPPGRYRASVRMPVTGVTAAWTVRSATLGERDVLDTPFDVRPGDAISGLTVTLTDAASELGGAITDASGKAVSQLYVLVFSTDKSQWDFASRRTMSMRASDAGVYSFKALPPGEYFMCALTEIDTARVSADPSYLEELAASSIRLTLGES